MVSRRAEKNGDAADPLRPATDAVDFGVDGKILALDAYEQVIVVSCAHWTSLAIACRLLAHLARRSPSCERRKEGDFIAFLYLGVFVRDFLIDGDENFLLVDQLSELRVPFIDELDDVLHRLVFSQGEDQAGLIFSQRLRHAEEFDCNHALTFRCSYTHCAAATVHPRDRRCQICRPTWTATRYRRS